MAAPGAVVARCSRRSREEGFRPAPALAAEEGRALVREFRFKDYYRTMSFVNALAHMANVEDHHPDLSVHYDRCVVRYSTHDVGGLSENDFICAARASALYPG